MERLTFKEYLLEDDRSKTLKKINDLSEQIFSHLIKILKYESEYDYNNHLTDINQWILDVQKLIEKCSIKLKYEHIKNELLKYIDTFKKFKKYCDYLNKKYSKLKVIRNDEDVYTILVDIIDNLSLDLSKLNYKHIKDYL